MRLWRLEADELVAHNELVESVMGLGVASPLSIFEVDTQVLLRVRVTSLDMLDYNVAKVRKGLRVVSAAIM